MKNTLRKRERTDKVIVLKTVMGINSVHYQGGSLTVYFKLIQILTGDIKIHTKGLSPRLPLQEHLKMDIVCWVPRLFWEPEPLSRPCSL